MKISEKNQRIKSPKPISFLKENHPLMKGLSVQLVSQYEKIPSPGYAPVVDVEDVWAGEMAKVFPEIPGCK